MSNSAKKSDCPLDQVLSLATKTAKKELGTTPVNKSVTAEATLNTSVTENDTTSKEGVNASVSLGVTSSSGPAAKPTCCDPSSGCCK